MIDKDGLSLREAVDDYLDYCTNVKQLCEHTVKTYETGLNKLMECFGEEMPAAQITKRMMVAFVDECSYNRTAKGIKKLIAPVRSMYNYLIECELVDDNPLERIKAKKRNHDNKIKCLTVSELETFLRAAYELLEEERKRKLSGILSHNQETGIIVAARNVAMLETFIATGMRVSEAIDMKWAEYREEDKSFRIRGKGKKYRRVWLNDESVKAIEDYYSLAGRADSAQNIIKEGNVFCGRWGEPLTYDAVYKSFDKINAHAGLAFRVKLHMIRHTFATLQEDAGVDIKTLQELLGHSSIATTELYVHPTENRLYKVTKESNIRSMVCVKY